MGFMKHVSMEAEVIKRKQLLGEPIQCKNCSFFLVEEGPPGWGECLFRDIIPDPDTSYVPTHQWCEHYTDGLTICLGCIYFEDVTWSKDDGGPWGECPGVSEEQAVAHGDGSPCHLFRGRV